MIEHTLKRLGIPPSTDYVKAFDEFLRWAVEGSHEYIVRRRRAAAAFRLGDYATALHDGRWCVLQRPHDAQAHLIHGLAALGAAAVEVVPIGMLGAGGDTVAEPPPALLAEARRGFERTLEEDAKNSAAQLAVHAVRDLEARVPSKMMGMVRHP